MFTITSPMMLSTWCYISFDFTYHSLSLYHFSCEIKYERNSKLFEDINSKHIGFFREIFSLSCLLVDQQIALYFTFLNCIVQIKTWIGRLDLRINKVKIIRCSLPIVIHYNIELCQLLLQWIKVIIINHSFKPLSAIGLLHDIMIQKTWRFLYTNTNY